MRRREFIAVLGGMSLAWPVGVCGQQTAIPVVAFLHGGSAGGRELYAVRLREGLADSGYVEGNNVAVEYRWAEGHYDRLPELAEHLVQARPSVIVAATLPVAVAVKHATSTIPIVFWVGDNPIKLGLVASLARPGGNATGVTMFSVGLLAKRLQLLRELVPASQIAVLLNPKNPNFQSQSREVEETGRSFGDKFEILQVTSEPETEAALASTVYREIGGLLIGADPIFINFTAQIVASAARYKVPTIYERREFVEAGGLISYGTDQIGSFRQVGVYAGKILAGAKASDLPVVRPTKFELVINLKTAKALGLTVPQSLLARADEVIE